MQLLNYWQKTILNINLFVRVRFSPQKAAEHLASRPPPENQSLVVLLALFLSPRAFGWSWNVHWESWISTACVDWMHIWCTRKMHNCVCRPEMQLLTKDRSLSAHLKCICACAWIAFVRARMKCTHNDDSAVYKLPPGKMRMQLKLGLNADLTGKSMWTVWRITITKLASREEIYCLHVPHLLSFLSSSLLLRSATSSLMPTSSLTCSLMWAASSRVLLWLTSVKATCDSFDF